MNENLKKLYESLSSRGYYTKSFEDFQKQYQDPAYQDKVFGVVTRDGLYTKDKDSFISKYSPSADIMPQEELKKKGQLDSTGLPSAGVSSGLSSKTPPVEKDYFEGAFGDVLRGLDNVMPIGIGDFVDDMARSVAAGYRQGTVAQEADNLLLSGAKATPEEIQKFIEANKSAAQLGQSKEMQDYMKTYEEEGKGFWGVVKGLVTNPTVIPEVLTSSLTSLATNTDALKAGSAAVGTGTAYGAATGAAAGGVGALPGAAAGAIASVPYAFGLASSVVEAGSTFGELLQEQLGGEEMTKENVKAILENPDKLQEIRNKAIARGIVIGAADAFTGKLASGVGAKILTKSAAKSATGAATKGAVTAATAAGAGIEAAGGSLGEVAARGAIGQEMDVSEIALEGLAELPGGIRSTIQARLAKPVYKVNGAVTTKEEIDNIIETMSPDDLSKTKIDIENDYEGRKFKLQDKITTGSIKEQVKNANPDLNEASLNAIVELEKQLRALEGNTTQTGKDKAAALRSQIKNIQENQLEEEVKVATPEVETPEITAKRTERITELETVLSQPDNGKGTVTIGEELVPRTELETELQTLKTEQDAIQKQTAGQVPVQPTAGVSETVEVGKPQAELEVTTKEGEAKAEEVKPTAEETPVEFSADEIEALKEDIGKIEEQGTLSGNLGEKVYIGNEEGNIKIEGQQYVFESNNTIKELGNVNEVGDSFIASFGISKFPSEGVKAEKTTEGAKPNIVTIEGKEFTFLRSRKPEGGKAVIVVKDNETGLQRVIKGDGAEKVLKDISLQKPAPEVKLELQVEGKPVVEKTKEELKREARAERKKAREEFEAKSLEEITQMQERLDRESAKFESDLLETIAKESKKESRLLVASDGKEFIVTKKANGEFSVSQKNSGGKFVGIKDAQSRKKAIDLFNKLKESKDKNRLKQAEDLSNEFKKEQSDKILSALDKAIAATSTKGKAYDATLGLPLMAANAVLKIVRAAYKGGKSLAEAIKDGHNFLKKEGYLNVSEYDLKKYVLENLGKKSEPKTEPKSQPPSDGEGFNKIKNSVDADVLKGKKVDEVLSRVQKSDAYKKLNDTDKENITRYIKKAFGEKIKKAPSAKKLLGFLKDVKKVTMDEMTLLKKQFKDMAKGAKTAKQAITSASKELTESLKALEKKGDITTKQMFAVLRKLNKTNLLDSASVEKFVDYMAKVFSDAEYADKIMKAFSQIKTAKKNIRTKIGISEQLYPLLNRMFSMNPNMIPDSVFEKYLELLDMFAQKEKVLTLKNKEEVTALANDIVNAIDEELSLSEELAIRFADYQDKVLDENGKLDYAATIEAMLKDQTITDDEAKIMRKYKSKILPPAQKAKKTDAELEQEKQDLLEALNGVEIDTENLPTNDEREVARKLERLIKSDAVKEMSIEQLTNLLKVIDNINNGYLPHYAQLILERLNAIDKGIALSNAIDKAKPLSLTKVYTNIKGIFTRKDSISEMIRRSPLYYIDQLFGNFKTKDIFDSLFKSAAEAETLFKSNITKIQNKLDEAQTAVAKSFGNRPNETLMSKFKMMTYMIQLEYLSNPNSKQVNPASEYLKATIKHIDEGKSSFGERDAEMLQEILDTYKDADGNIDIDKLYKSFNSAEKKAITTIKEINDSLAEKAVHTSAIIRGDKINLLENYVHLNVLHDAKPDDEISGVTSAAAYNESLKPSTKAKSLISRTGKVAPLNFDVFASAQRGAKFVLMDYYLTEPIRTARKTINEATAMMEKDGRIPKEKRQILSAISSAFEETTENLLNNVFITNSFADEVSNYLSKSGYRAVLASVPRFIAELTSNISFALFTDPKALTTGFKYRDVAMSSDAVKILNNLGSKQTNRIFPNEALAGRLIDSSIMSQASGIKGGRAKSDVANVIQMLYNNSLKKFKNSVETLSDTLISTPDKIVMRPLWIGSFANEFKRITGTDIDFDKIANNDTDYILENKDALDDARDIADQRSVLTGATDNPYMDILKGKVKPNQSALTRAFNIFNNYMTRFAIYEYTTARTGIMAAMGNGSLSRKQGVALMAGATSRMILYTLLAQSLSDEMVGLFSDDEEEEDEKSLGKKLGQAMTSTFTSLLIGRDFGNATKTFVNYGLERMNEKYLDNLREGEYDPYKDAIQYTIVPPDAKGKKTDLNDFLMNMGGPFGPSLKTANLIARKLTEDPKKKEDAIERSEKEVNVRIPLEILGNAGLVPLYKDVRKVVMKNIYKDLEKAEKSPETEQDDFKPYGLNKEELKKYMPDLYEQYYGEGTNYQKTSAKKRELRKKKEELRKKILDERYNYIPSKKKEFGSSEFGDSELGSSKTTSSKKKGFGSSEFGSK
jgi:uncharacterized protein YwbE